jgi:tetratricopeptide (TPR) repeat protein
MNEKYTLEDLEAYLSGALSPEKRERFEADLMQDKALLDDLEALKASREAIQLAAWKSIIGEVHRDFIADEQNETPVRPITKAPTSGLTWMMRIAASFLILLVAGGTIFVASISPDSITSQQIEYVVPVMRSGESGSSDLKEAYAKGAFQEVVDIAESSNLIDEESQFLLGLALLKTENFQEAIQKLSALQNTTFEDPADYYLVQAYLEQGDFNQAKEIMKKTMKNSDHAYRNNFDQLDIWKVQILDWKN